MVVAVVLALIIAGCSMVGSAPIERMNAKTAMVSAVDSDRAWVRICSADINAPNPAGTPANISIGAIVTAQAVGPTP